MRAGFLLGRVAQRHVDRVARDRDLLVLDARVAKLLAEVALEPLQELGDGASVSTSYTSSMPPRRSRPRLIGSIPSAFSQSGAREAFVSAMAKSPSIPGLDQVARLELVVHRREPRPQATVIVDVHFLGRDARVLQGACDLRHRRGVKLGAVAARQLQGRRFAVPVRQREQDRRDHDGRQQDSLPEGIALHAERTGALRRP